MQKVLEALGDNQSHPHSFPLQQSIGCHGGAHPDPLNVGGVQGLVGWDGRALILWVEFEGIMPDKTVRSKCVVKFFLAQTIAIIHQDFDHEFPIMVIILISTY